MIFIFMFSFSNNISYSSIILTSLCVHLDIFFFFFLWFYVLLLLLSKALVLGCRLRKQSTEKIQLLQSLHGGNVLFFNVWGSYPKTQALNLQLNAMAYLISIQNDDNATDSWF